MFSNEALAEEYKEKVGLVDLSLSAKNIPKFL
jgi:hypothetical protein